MVCNVFNLMDTLAVDTRDLMGLELAAPLIQLQLQPHIQQKHHFVAAGMESIVEQMIGATLPTKTALSVRVGGLIRSEIHCHVRLVGTGAPIAPRAVRVWNVFYMMDTMAVDMLELMGLQLVVTQIRLQ